MSRTSYDPSRIIYDPRTGFYIDTETGEVLEDQEIVGGYRAQRFIDQEELWSKKHWAPISLWVHDQGLTTMFEALIPRHKLRPIFSQRYAKLSSLQRRLRINKYSERRLVRILQYIRQVGRILGLPRNIIDDVCLEYKKHHQKTQFGPESRHTRKIIAVLLVTVARRYNVTLTMDDVLKALDLRGNTMISRTARDICQVKPQSTPMAIQDLWSRYFGDHVNLLHTAVKIVRKTLESDPRITGKSRKSIVGGLAYMLLRLTGYEVKQSEIAKKIGITEVSVRNTFKHLISNHEIIAEVE